MYCSNYIKLYLQPVDDKGFPFAPVTLTMAKDLMQSNRDINVLFTTALICSILHSLMAQVYYDTFV